MSPRRTILAAVGIVLILLATAPPVAVRAADDIVWLPGRSLAAIGLDLDGDPGNELLRLVPDDGNAINAEAWDVIDGRWQPIGDSAPVRAEAEEPAADQTIVAQLMTWRRDGRDRALVVTALTSVPTGPTENCCFAIAEVALRPEGLVIDPLPLAGYDSASIIQPLDIEADGTDELLITTFSFSDQFSSRVDLVRWQGSRLAGAELSTDVPGYVGTIGDTDGVAGDEVLVWSDGGDGFSRLSWHDGAVVEEPWPGEELAYPYGSLDGDLLLQAEGELRRVRWPRDAAPTTVASSVIGAFGTPLIATSGTDTVILVAGADFGLQEATTIVLGPNLERLGEVEIRNSRPLWALAGEYAGDGSLFPFLGPFPMRRGETEVWLGGSVVAAGGPDGYRVREASPFVGIVPLGVVGPDDGWTIAGSALQHAPPGYPAFLGGIGEASPVAATLRLLPRDHGARAASAAEDIEIAIRNAIEVEAGDGTRELLAGPSGFTIEVTAPFGTAVAVIHDGDSDVMHLPADGTLPVAIAPDRGSLERDEAFSRTVVVVSPDGRFEMERWTGRFVAGDLEASASAQTVPFEWAATISGDTMAGAVIVAPGASATADADGRFRLRVDAPIWPQDVTISIEDPFGRTLDMELAVVGFVDSRGWPWMALVGLVVVAAGVALYVRVPRMRPEREPPPEAPMFEEL
jgi:hypothetical protein